jgi:hypothetical protein
VRRCRDNSVRGARLSLCIAMGVVACSGLACTPTQSSSAGPAPSATPSSSAPLPAGSTPEPRATTVETWSGKYVSAAGSVYVFDGGEWASVSWRGDDAGLGLGEGTMSVKLDRKAGVIHGVAGGAIGDAVISGALVPEEVRSPGSRGERIMASVARKDPLDRGLSGTLEATAQGDKLIGTMRLSPANARVVRQASFTLTRDPP